MFSYITPDDLDSLFEMVKMHYTRYEEIPHYRDEAPGMGKLLGVLAQVQAVFYPSLFDKATYLFIQINKGHFFSNGNKRLALAVALTFLAKNNRKLRTISGGIYRENLTKLFGAISFEEYSEFTPEEFALYHLSLIVAESHKYIGDDFDALKQKVHDFFVFAIEEDNNTTF